MPRRYRRLDARPHAQHWPFRMVGSEMALAKGARKGQRAAAEAAG